MHHMARVLHSVRFILEHSRVQTCFDFSSNCATSNNMYKCAPNGILHWGRACTTDKISNGWSEVWWKLWIVNLLATKWSGFVLTEVIHQGSGKLASVMKKERRKFRFYCCLVQNVDTHLRRYLPTYRYIFKAFIRHPRIYHHLQDFLFLVSCNHIIYTVILGL